MESCEIGMMKSRGKSCPRKEDHFDRGSGSDRIRARGDNSTNESEIGNVRRWCEEDQELNSDDEVHPI